MTTPRETCTRQRHDRDIGALSACVRALAGTASAADLLFMTAAWEIHGFSSSHRDVSTALSIVNFISALMHVLYRAVSTVSDVLSLHCHTTSTTTHATQWESVRQRVRRMLLWDATRPNEPTRPNIGVPLTRRSTCLAA